MKPAVFEYHRPDTLADALSLLDRLGDDARLLSGGQSLIPMMNLRLATPAHLIDLAAIAELSGISVANGEVRIGAMTRQRELLSGHPALDNVPLLPLAAMNIGHVQTRNRGTVGGSLANADPAAELSLTMVALDATIVVAGRAGERRVSAREFFVDAMTTVLEPDEIIVAAVIPVQDRKPVCRFREIARRHGDFALASVAVQRFPPSGELSVGIGAVATTPRHCRHLGARLSAGPAGRDEIVAAMERDFADVNLLDDGTASADYRKMLAVELLLDCLGGMVES